MNWIESYAANPGLADIASNFTVNDYIDITAGGCLTGQGEGKLRFLCIEATWLIMIRLFTPARKARRIFISSSATH